MLCLKCLIHYKCLRNILILIINILMIINLITCLKAKQKKYTNTLQVKLLMTSVFTGDKLIFLS